MRLHLIPLKNLKDIFVLIFPFIWAFTAYSQTSKIDSLRIEISVFENSKSFDENNIDYVIKQNAISELYFFRNLDSVLYYSNKAYYIAKKNNFINEEIIAIINKGHYYFNIGKSEESLLLLNEALTLSKKHKNRNQGTILNKLGFYQYDLGNYSEALKSYVEATKLAEKTSDKILMSIVKENIASLYIAQNDLKQALEIYKEVNEINNELGNEQFIGETKANTADLYLRLKDYDSANLEIDYSISIFEKNKSYEWLSTCYKTKGDIYLKQDSLQLALYWYSKSLALHENLNDDIYKAPLLNALAEANLKLKKITEAEQFALSSLELSEKLFLLENITNSYKILYQINKENSNPLAALAYHEKYKFYFDSISRKKNLISIGNLKTKLAFDEQQKSIEIANEKALAQQNVYIYLALFTLVIFGVIIFLLKKQSKIRKGFNIILQLKNKALEKREIELSEINTTKDKLFSIIGHDLRGPINALGGILKMLKEKEISEKEFAQFIPKVSTDVDAISFTLNNLLSWGRAQMYGATLEPSKISIHKLVDDTIKFLDEISKNKKLKIYNNISEQITVWVDKNQMDVILRNLLSNAIKFSNVGEEIHFSSVEHEKYVEISIKDTGVGISNELKSKLFSNTYTLVSTYGTANEKGTGLGLNLCKEMIQKNGGEIWMESVLGDGSTFYIKLPKNKLD